MTKLAMSLASLEGGVRFESIQRFEPFAGNRSVNVAPSDLLQSGPVKNRPYGALTPRDCVWYLLSLCDFLRLVLVATIPKKTHSARYWPTPSSTFMTTLVKHFKLNIQCAHSKSVS